MKILVVDDDQGLRKSLTLILEDGGHDVLLAANGEEGLGVAANENTQIILCDVRMPKMDGLQFLARYRKAVRSLTKAGAREQEVQRARAELEVLREEFEGSDAGEAELESFAARPALRELLRIHAPAAPPVRARRRSR